MNPIIRVGLLSCGHSLEPEVWVVDEFLARFRTIVGRSSHKTAVSDKSIALSYRELDAASDRLAAILREALGAEHTVVAYLGRMTVDCVTLNIAAGKAGFGLVALDPGHPDAALREIIEHADATALRDAQHRRRQGRFRARGARPGPSRRRAPGDHRARRCDGGGRDARIRGAGPAADRTRPGADPHRTPRARGDSRVRACGARSRGDPLHLSYTSGSTGRPKGVPISRRIADLRWQQKLDFYGTTEDDICAVVNTFWWYKPLWPLAVGAEAACFDFASEGLVGLDAWLRARKVTVLNTYVAMYRELGEAAPAPYPDLRQIILGGEAARVGDVRNFDRISVPGAELMLRLACQELGPLTMFVHRHGDPINYERVPMGTILRPDRVKLLDESGNEVAVGAVGEITASGEIVPAGYHKDPERSREQFSRNADGTWTFRMGDLAIRDARGTLKSMGRKDQQVKIRGYNVRPHEVEEKILRHEGVREAAVRAIEDARGVPRLAAFYVGAGDHPPTPTELRAFLAETLPNYQVPSTMIRRESLPRRPNGKLDRMALALPMKPVPDRSAVLEARTETEKIVSRIWEKVLGRSGFGFDEDFFDLGGDSLMAMSMLLEAERATNSRIPLEALSLNGATLRAVVDQLEANRPTGEDSCVPVMLQRGTRSDPPIYAMHVQGGHLSDYLRMIPGMSGQTVLGIHPKGMRSAARPDMRIEQLAEHCADIIERHAEPGQPIRLMGYSFGGILGYETAGALAARGLTVSHLILLDPPALWARRFHRLRAIKRYFGGDRTGKTAPRVMASFTALLGLAP
ncbi:AMP-binding protein, partial [Amaricoccus sp. W119]|uniref:AMP-binding protein n=1 Tax=Amaricoccus sp. W119 TaxID=3391833 RepID=UPI0039A5A419